MRPQVIHQGVAFALGALIVASPVLTASAVAQQRVPKASEARGIPPIARRDYPIVDDAIPRWLRFRADRNERPLEDRVVRVFPTATGGRCVTFPRAPEAEMQLDGGSATYCYDGKGAFLNADERFY